jgi:hypothetical protein
MLTGLEQKRCSRGGAFSFARRVFSAVVFAVLIAAAGCTNVTTSTGPSSAKCQITVRQPVPAVEASGGTAMLEVSAQPECAWKADSDISWIAEVTPASGQGSGQVEVRVVANTQPAQRQGAIRIGGASVAILQKAAACVYDVTPGTRAIGSAGGTTTVALTAASSCDWNAASDTSWLTIVSAPTGSGNATVTIRVEPNAGIARIGSVTIAGQPVTINQDAGNTAALNCAYKAAPTAVSVGAEGGPQTVAITADRGCSWAATSSVPWLVVTSGASGSGDGTVQLSVTVNAGALRNGVLNVAGQAVTVVQAAAPAPNPPSLPNCTYSIGSASQSISAAGGAGQAVTVTAPAGCAWSATSGAPWLTISSGTSGSGNGSVTFTAAANTGAQRTGTLSVAGQTFTVTQAAGTTPCTYSINPTQRNVSKGAQGNSGIAVSTQSTCGWTATSNATWITITGGTPHTGNGTATYTVAANSGPARSGTITIAGLTFTVNQDSGCTYAVSPTRVVLPKKAGTASLTVVTAGGCTWSATTTTSWITISNGTNRSGNGVFDFAVTANPGGKRTGKIFVATETVDVEQDDH